MYHDQYLQQEMLGAMYVNILWKSIIAHEICYVTLVTSLVHYFALT